MSEAPRPDPRSAPGWSVVPRLRNRGWRLEGTRAAADYPTVAGCPIGRLPPRCAELKGCEAALKCGTLPLLKAPSFSRATAPPSATTHAPRQHPAAHRTCSPPQGRRRHPRQGRASSRSPAVSGAPQRAACAQDAVGRRVRDAGHVRHSAMPYVGGSTSHRCSLLRTAWAGDRMVTDLAHGRNVAARQRREPRHRVP